MAELVSRKERADPLNITLPSKLKVTKNRFAQKRLPDNHERKQTEIRATALQRPKGKQATNNRHPNNRFSANRIAEIPVPGLRPGRQINLLLKEALTNGHQVQAGANVPAAAGKKSTSTPSLGVLALIFWRCRNCFWLQAQAIGSWFFFRRFFQQNRCRSFSPGRL